MRISLIVFTLSATFIFCLILPNMAKKLHTDTYVTQYITNKTLD